MVNLGGRRVTQRVQALPEANNQCRDVRQIGSIVGQRGGDVKALFVGFAGLIRMS